MNEANVEELESLNGWLEEDPQNVKTFNTYLRINYAMDMNLNPFDTEKAKKDYLERIRADIKLVQRKRMLVRVRYAAAAVIVLFLTSTLFYTLPLSDSNPESKLPIIVNNQIKPGSDKASLVLETGETIDLGKESTFQNQHASSDGAAITYKNNNVKELSYNYLNVPRGGQFQLTLADGTKVWLNSETQLKYPIGFIEGQSRKVELIHGEAYFEVSPSELHKGADFWVVHDEQEVRVLGTAFNIKAYREEAYIYTTLVEGSISLSRSLNQKGAGRLEDMELVPGEQASLNIQNDNLIIQKINIRPEIAWREGLYIFKRKSLKEIMGTLSRWYDMDVIVDEKELNEIEFTGSLSKQQDIIDILNDIKNFGAIEYYEINDKTILLK